MVHLLNQIANENDKITKNITMATFLDLSKAFDSLSHSLLLRKFENMGVRGVANIWFCSYLTERKQYMEMYKVKSNLDPLQCGVPQGSILGPILFLLYINDIPNSTSLKVLCFADDTTCRYSSASISNLYNVMNDELEKLNQWFRANKLCLNISKTKYIIFRPSVTRHIESDHTLLPLRELVINLTIHPSNFWEYLLMKLSPGKSTLTKFVSKFHRQIM